MGFQVKYFILISLFILSNAGCAFVGGGAIGDVEYTSPKQIGPQYTYKLLNSDFTLRQSAVVGSKPFQFSDIEREWGKPSKIVIDGPEGKSLGLFSESSCQWHKDMTPY